jgi:hypothetical protein
MLRINKILSDSRLHRLKAQGYFGYSDSELSSLAFGNRFAYIICTLILIIGVVTANVSTLLLMSLVAFGGSILPYHPFDYIYNHLLRYRINKPELPPRSKQLKFTCKVATLWLIVTAYLFYDGFTTAGYVLGSLLATVAFIVGTTDVCIPSKFYNLIFKIKV